MRETSVPGKQISTTGIQDLGEVAILDSMQFRCKERYLPRGRERRKNHRSEDLNICLREGETRRRRGKSSVRKGRNAARETICCRNFRQLLKFRTFFRQLTHTS